MGQLASYPATFAGPQPTANWNADDPLLDQFQIGVETDGQFGIKVGDGVSRWKQLRYINPVLRSYLAADVTYNDTATLANTSLAVTVPKPSATQNDYYRIELDVFSANATKGLKLDFLANLPNGVGDALPDNWVGHWQAVTDGVAANTATNTSNDTVFAPTTGFDGASNLVRYSFRGSFEVLAGQDDGTVLTLRAAQNSAHASDTTILQGSTLILTRLN